MIRALVLAIVMAAGTAQAQCRQALAMGLDVSGSVDAREYRLQMDGLAAALTHADVRRALLAYPSAPVMLSVYEWSGPDYQSVIIGWTAIRDGADVDRIVARLRGTRRRAAPPGTALGTAMQTGARLLAQRAECWKRTLDISGDGKRNLGPHPRDVRHAMAQGQITVNALVIGADAPAFGDLRHADIAELSSYFRAYVASGADGFVETALGFDEYEAAMVRKLKRELEGLTVSDLAAP